MNKSNKTDYEYNHDGYILIQKFKKLSGLTFSSGNKFLVELDAYMKICNFCTRCGKNKPSSMLSIIDHNFPVCFWCRQQAMENVISIQKDSLLPILNIKFKKPNFFQLFLWRIKQKIKGIL